MCFSAHQWPWIWRRCGGSGVSGFIGSGIFVRKKLCRTPTHESPDSASQQPECNGSAPHYSARLFDHGDGTGQVCEQSLILQAELFRHFRSQLMGSKKKNLVALLRVFFFFLEKTKNYFIFSLPRGPQAVFSCWCCFDEQTRGREQKIRKPATLQESPVALHSTQSAMGLLHTITAAYLITASEASRCVTG